MAEQASGPNQNTVEQPQASASSLHNVVISSPYNKENIKKAKDCAESGDFSNATEEIDNIKKEAKKQGIVFSKEQNKQLDDILTAAASKNINSLLAHAMETSEPAFIADALVIAKKSGVAFTDQQEQQVSSMLTKFIPDLLSDAKKNIESGNLKEAKTDAFFIKAYVEKGGAIISDEQKQELKAIEEKLS